MDPNRNTPGKTIKSLDTAFDIVEHLHEVDGARIAELSKSLGMPKSTIHSHLATLRNRGYVVQEGDIYYVGLLFLNLGTGARERHVLYDIAKPKMERLAKETNERTQLMIEEQGRGIYVYRARGSRSIQTASRIGEPRYLHTSAAGKAILARYPDDQVERIIDQWDLKSMTEQTLTSRDQLFEELATIREQGYATNREERIEGLWAIGAAITAPRSVLGALSVSGPTFRIKEQQRETEIRNQLLGVINEIELELRSSQ
ncbi:IclR family transcriptional regulator [Halomarina halobia]|uniref:IclR family transcriptional regulator n=1 Tax=Halomarina halobia TaxID=3033386 RepID=A0ABD6AGP0_9EURY|nr:IclR family transcriptional regulator [Halomarina sp. PSR21]